MNLKETEGNYLFNYIGWIMTKCVGDNGEIASKTFIDAINNSK